MPNEQPELDSLGPSARATLGTVCLISGALLIVLIVVDRTGGIPFHMPRFWYLNRWLWTPLSMLLVAVGVVALKTRTQLGNAWRPARSGRRFDSVTLYSRPECHLCDQAKDLLLKYAAYLPIIDEVNIQADAELLQRFDTCVPVVAIDGKIRFRGRIDEILLRRLIEGTRPKKCRCCQDEGVDC